MSQKSKKFEASALSSVGLQIPEPSSTLLDRLIQKISTSEQSASEGERQSRGYPLFDPDRSYQVGDHVAIPLELISDNPHNPRVFFGGEQSGLIQSLKESGQLVPVMVYPANEDGKFVLKSGHRRVRALRALGRDSVKAEIVALGGNPLEEFVQARAINMEQQEQSVLDDCVSFKRLLDTQVAKTQYELSAAVDLAKGTLSKYLSIADLPTKVLEAMAERPDKFKFSMAYLIFLTYTKWGNDEARVLELIAQIDKERYSTREVEDMLQRNLNEVSARKPRSSPLARTKLTGVGVGELKAFEDKLVLKLSDLSPQIRDSVYHAVLSALTEVQSNAAKEAQNSGL